MKKIVTVTTTKTIDIDIPDSFLTTEKIQEFEYYMFPICTRNKINGLFNYTAEEISKDNLFIEEISEASNYNDPNSDKSNITFHILSDYTETYIENSSN